jgi:predicted oxidoreductase
LQVFEEVSEVGVSVGVGKPAGDQDFLFGQGLSPVVGWAERGSARATVVAGSAKPG